MLQIDLTKIDTAFDGTKGYCYVHARSGLAPDGRMLMTLQKLRLSGSDAFQGLEMTHRNADGSWSSITKCANLVRRKWKGDYEIAMCDATPFYHRHSGCFLLTGHCALYDKNDELLPDEHPRSTLWSTWNESLQDWNDYQQLKMPEGFFNSGAGSTQILEEPDGTLLIPAYVKRDGTTLADAFVMRCSFDGKTLLYQEHGNRLGMESGRGFCEPSIARQAGRYFLTLRNDDSTYVATSEDGLHFCPAMEWYFDDGTPLGSYCTQEHWVTGEHALYLVYTRRTESNNHVFRHRAPLFIAEVDTDTCRVKRETEQIAVPERGARLGNFGICQADFKTAYVTAAEWMQTNPPDCCDYTVCMKYGSNNSIWISRVTGLR